MSRAASRLVPAGMGHIGLIAIVLVALSAALPPAHAAPLGPQLIRDINAQATPAMQVTGTSSAVIGGTLYFSGGTPDSGAELWKTDGTAAGTARVKDINPGNEGSFPEQFTVAGDLLYFTTFIRDRSTSVLAAEIWRSDGSADGTIRLRSFPPGRNPVTIRELTAAGDALYFFASNDDGLHDLWRSDGTARGTVSIDTTTWLPLSAIGTTLFYANDDPQHGLELWAIADPARGPVLLKDINPGAASSGPFLSRAVGDTLYFAADDGVHGVELWGSDGTAAGTVLLSDINPGAASGLSHGPLHATAQGDTLYVVADQDPAGHTLWRSDGTAAGTTRVKTVSAGVGVTQLIAVGATIYFFVADTGSPKELWRSDGTAAGTAIFRSFAADAASWVSYSLGVLGDTLFFTEDDGQGGLLLWRSDGTASGTVPITGLSRRLALFAAMGAFFYSIAGDEAEGYQLWRIGAGETAAARVMPLPTGLASSDPRDVFTVGGSLYVVADDGQHGAELWRSDLTPSGTTLLKDINPGAAGSWGAYLAAIGGTFFFVATDGVSGYELWKSDGTAAGTALVKDINPGPGSSIAYFAPREVAVIGTALYFSATDGEHGYELWRSDGTAAGTFLVRDANPGSENAFPENLMVMGGELYFTAKDFVSRRYLWRSDGTEAGTIRLSGEVSLFPRLAIAQVGRTIYFPGADAEGRESLWKTDGTVGGTVRVEGIAPAAASFGPRRVFAVGDRIYFTTNRGEELWRTDGTAAGTTRIARTTILGDTVVVVGAIFYVIKYDPPGWRLWRSDGTEAGTRPVHVLEAEVQNGPLIQAAVVGDTLYYTANDPATGWELWKITGLGSEPVQVKDINPGPEGSAPSQLMAVGAGLCFAADDSRAGREPWCSDGTEAGTARVGDINLGTFSSDPVMLGESRGRPIFSAFDARRGRELWTRDMHEVALPLLRR